MPDSRTSSRARFVTVCQQVLALGVIGAALTPAVNVLNLDIVPGGPLAAGAPVGEPAAGAAPASMAAYVKATERPSLVPTAAIDPTVQEFAMTAPSGARIAPGMLAARTVPSRAGSTTLVSKPQRVTGYGAVGVTWQHGDLISEKKIHVDVRTRQDGAWSGWQPVAYHDDHGPDAGSAEAATARPGTDEMLVGDVNQVQVRVATTKAAPPDMKLAVVDPGRATSQARERPALDTNDLDGASPPAVPAVATSPATVTTTGRSGDEQAVLAAAAYTPKPVIYSRAQWGADESMREPSSLHYYEVHAGFVHHTATANGYKASDVPAIIRSVYAYHTQSKGWSDIGYNFLVDRFGRIWEGRYGGIDRPVVGAHTLGYNDDSFAASAIGNYEEVQPSQAMIEAYGALFAWKLSLHGVNASSTRQYVTSRYFEAINGHRDAGQTACPGKYLYAKLPEIRTLAAQTQVGWAGRQLESNVASTDEPDLMVRRASDGQGFTIPIKAEADGTYAAGRPIPMAVDLSGTNRILDAGDWDRDGYADLITRSSHTGKLYLRRGLGNGRFAAVHQLAAGFKRVQLLAAVGDMTGDGYPDLMGQPAGGAMQIYPGNGTAGLKAPYVAFSHIDATRQIGIGRWNGDGSPDTLLRKGPTLSVMAGNGPGGLTGSPTKLSTGLKGYDWTVGISDVALTGHPDVVLRSKDDGNLWLVRATSAGLQAPVLLGTGMDIYDMVD